MNFPYIQYDFAPSPRPVIPIRVELDGQSLRYSVLVDSGADMNVFDRAIAEAMGIDVESGDAASFSGVTGSSSDLYFHDVVLGVGSRQVKVRAGFTDLPGKAYGVVGQRGFFDQFIVIFDLKAEEIELIPYESPAARR